MPKKHLSKFRVWISQFTSNPCGKHVPTRMEFINANNLDYRKPYHTIKTLLRYSDSTPGSTAATRYLNTAIYPCEAIALMGYIMCYGYLPKQPISKNEARCQIGFMLRDLTVAQFKRMSDSMMELLDRAHKHSDEKDYQKLPELINALYNAIIRLESAAPSKASARLVMDMASDNELFRGSRCAHKRADILDTFDWQHIERSLAIKNETDYSYYQLKKKEKAHISQKLNRSKSSNTKSNKKQTTNNTKEKE